MYKQPQRKQHKPFFLVASIQECGTCRKMEANTYTYEPFADFVETQYLAYKIDAFDFSQGGLDIAQKLGISIFPTIMVFDENGDKLATFTGYYNGPTLLAEFKLQKNIIIKRQEMEPDTFFNPPILSIEEQDPNTALEKMKQKATLEEFPNKEQYYQDIANTIEAPKDIKVEEPPKVVESPSQSKSAAGPMFSMANNATNSAYGMVDGFENRALINKKPNGYGFEVMKTTNIESLKERMLYLEKRWKRDIWVYSYTHEGVVSYHIIFGTFEDVDIATEYRENTKEVIPTVGDVVDLTKLK